MTRLTCLAGRLALVLVCLVTTLPAGAQAPKPAAVLDETRDVNLRAYTELLRSDIRAQKTGIITAIMQFSEADDAKFWPIYREYETELAKVNDRRLALIREYADTYEKMTDAVADRLAHGALDVEAQRHALKVKYYDRLAKVLPPITAARFLQVENQLLLLLDLQIASSRPIVQ
jgi:hypothetical protein